MSLAIVSKLAFAVVLGMAVLASAVVRAPRRSVPTADLRRLVACALLLYVIGGAATLTDHPALAAIVYATGIAIAALAAWLSRGRDQDDPPGGGDDPFDQRPPPEPGGMPRLDWDRFEHEFRDWERRRPRQPTAR